MLLFGLSAPRTIRPNGAEQARYEIVWRRPADPPHLGPSGAAPSCLQRPGGVAVKCADGRRGQASGHPHWSGRRQRARCRVSDRGAALDPTRASAHGRGAARVRGSRGGGTQHPVATGRLGDRDAAGGVLNGLVERSRSSTLAVGPLSAGVAAVQPAAAPRGLADPHRAAETALGPVRHTGPTARCRSRYGAQIAQGWSLRDGGTSDCTRGQLQSMRCPECGRELLWAANRAEDLILSRHCQLSGCQRAGGAPSPQIDRGTAPPVDGRNEAAPGEQPLWRCCSCTWRRGGRRAYAGTGPTGCDAGCGSGSAVTAGAGGGSGS